MSTDTVKRMSPAELTETCYRAAGTAAVAYVTGFVYRGADVNDDGSGWPTMSSEVEISDPTVADIFKAGILRAMVSEAGHLAVLKHRGLGSHGVNFDGELTDTRVILDDPKVWAAVEALAAHIEGNGDDELHSAMGTFEDEDGEDGSGLKVLKDAGLTPTYWADEGEAAAHARLLDTIAGGDAERRAAAADLFPLLRPDGTA